jgi:hypothetical protein
MKELIDAFKNKFGKNIGIVIYFDMSGHVFRDDDRLNHPADYEESLFSFDDITKVKPEDFNG